MKNLGILRLRWSNKQGMIELRDLKFGLNGDRNETSGAKG